ncbi:MAG: ATP-binding protein [Hyphomicrobiales bacterium]|nr:ATP-binding protein [Hyphomicrobiales bacterium]
MAAVTWLNLIPIHWLERIGRRLACRSRLAGFFGIESENGLTGLIALVALPAAFVASLASSLPLAFPVALATINLSIAGECRNAPNRAGAAELSLALLLTLVAVFFVVLAINGSARFEALAGATTSLVFAALPAILRHLMAAGSEDRSFLSRDVEGLDRLMPDERIAIVERNGRVAALSRSVIRQFAASGLKPGTDLCHLINILDRPLFLNALDTAGQQEQIISLRLNAELLPREQEVPRIDLSLAAIDSKTVIARLHDLPPQLPDRVRPDRTSGSAGQSAETVAAAGACDLEEAVRFTIRLLASDADKHGVRVMMRERPDRDGETALLANCSARVARQIALNVIGNAIKFSHAGGHVTIETDIDGQCGLLRVRDQGIGIAEQDREALFCPHKRGSGRDRPGWGLGLAIVGDLVAGCDGRIAVESAPGKGTTVTIRFPLAGQAGMDHHPGQIDPNTQHNQIREIARAA